MAKVTGTEMRSLTLRSGKAIPILGQGTWGMGEHPARQMAEIKALRLGIDLGLTLIDTAEMYGEGGAETLVGEAIEGRRRDVYLVSKVYPHNATRRGAIAACERSLKRMKTDYLDLYLLHWRGSAPLEETFEAFQVLKRAGKVLDCGVSNLDIDDLVEASTLPGGDEMVTDQVLYNLVHRGLEWDLMPWCLEQGIAVMAYSPIEHSPVDQRGMLDHPVLITIAARYGATPAQIAIAWLLHRKGVVVIPKAAKPEHIRENRAALEIKLTREDLMELDRAFPPPDRKIALEMR